MARGSLILSLGVLLSLWGGWSPLLTPLNPFVHGDGPMPWFAEGGVHTPGVWSGLGRAWQYQDDSGHYKHWW